MNAGAPTWGTWREAAAVVLSRSNVRRTATIAAIVGSVFFTMNQLGVIASGNADVVVWFKAALTYLTPLVVSNFGMLSATRRARESRPSATEPTN